VYECLFLAPAKVRAVERQAPITSFMKQQSSARIFTPRNSAAQDQFNSSRNSLGSGKVFQFKKKTSSLSEKENITTTTTSFDAESFNASSSSTSFLDQSKLEPPEPCAVARNGGTPSNQPYNARKRQNDFYDKPYSSFNPSRILLSESQEQLLCG